MDNITLILFKMTGEAYLRAERSIISIFSGSALISGVERLPHNIIPIFEDSLFVRLGESDIYEAAFRESIIRDKFLLFFGITESLCISSLMSSAARGVYAWLHENLSCAWDSLSEGSSIFNLLRRWQKKNTGS